MKPAIVKLNEVIEGRSSTKLQLVHLCMFILCIISSIDSTSAQHDSRTFRSPSPPGEPWIILLAILVLLFVVFSVFLYWAYLRSRRRYRTLGSDSFQLVAYPPPSSVGFVATECSICLEKFKAFVTELHSCHHIYHPSCIRTLMTRRQSWCPDCHPNYYRAGFLTTCVATLFSMYGILAHLSGMFSRTPSSYYMEIVYPIFSMFALLSLHIFMYGCNLFLWKSSRINYNFIFRLQPRTALKYSDTLLICISLMTTVVTAMVIHLVLLSYGFLPQQLDVIPGFLLLIFLIVLFCPLNIFYRPTRCCFLRVMQNIVFSPFSEAGMVDFFVADQLTSQIPLLRHMESIACYFIAGVFKTHEYETCKSGKWYKGMAYIISFAPYYWRSMQCARGWYMERDANQLLNFGKYVSAMVAAGARLVYEQKPESNLWLVIVLVIYSLSTLYQLYWDFVKDWGLLNRNSRNPWLRDELIVKNKHIYYVSIALNFFLRVSWMVTLMRFNVGSFESRLLEFFLDSLEVIRRGHWNFYRLENEHLKMAKVKFNEESQTQPLVQLGSISTSQTTSNDIAMVGEQVEGLEDMITEQVEGLEDMIREQVN